MYLTAHARFDMYQYEVQVEEFKKQLLEKNLARCTIAQKERFDEVFRHHQVMEGITLETALKLVERTLISNVGVL